MRRVPVVGNEGIKRVVAGVRKRFSYSQCRATGLKQGKSKDGGKKEGKRRREGGREENHQLIAIQPSPSNKDPLSLLFIICIYLDIISHKI